MMSTEDSKPPLSLWHRIMRWIFARAEYDELEARIAAMEERVETIEAAAIAQAEEAKTAREASGSKWDVL